MLLPHLVLVTREIHFHEKRLIRLQDVNVRNICMIQNGFTVFFLFSFFYAFLSRDDDNPRRVN